MTFLTQSGMFMCSRALAAGISVILQNTLHNFIKLPILFEQRLQVHGKEFLKRQSLRTHDERRRYPVSIQFTELLKAGGVVSCAALHLDGNESLPATEDIVTLLSFLQ